MSSLDVKINDAKDDLHYNVIYIITDTNIVKRENIFRLKVEIFNYVFLMRYHGYGIVTSYTNLFTVFCGPNLSPLPCLPNKDIFVLLYNFTSFATLQPNPLLPPSLTLAASQTDQGKRKGDCV